MTIIGRSLLSLPAEIELSWVDRLGWWIEIDGTLVELSARLLHGGFRHLSLRHGDFIARIVDHLLPIRLLGFDSICIRFKKRNRVPYFGCGEPYLEAIRQSYKKVGVLENYALRQAVRVELPPKELTFAPLFGGVIDIIVKIDYPNDDRIGTETFHWNVTEQLLLTASKAKSLGNFHLVRPLVKTLGRIGWPHGDEWVWRGQCEPATMRKILALHRVWDLLAAIAVALPAGAMTYGSIKTSLAGHTEDVLLVREIERVGWQKI